MVADAQIVKNVLTLSQILGTKCQSGALNSINW